MMPAPTFARSPEPTKHRLRVGDWRVRFERDASAREIVVLRVLPRGRAYDR
jgi:mRNA-degrading endonuclease RelE of RelBE toxin-antitoxin system